MSKYLYVPRDIAFFLKECDFTLSTEKKIKDAIWEERYEVLDPRYRKDKNKYIKEISNILNQYEDRYLYKEIQDINKVLEDIGSSYIVEEYNQDEQYVEALFRYIKLKLTYTSNVSYVKLKLRTLLRQLGYKRRTVQLTDDINRCLTSLKLETFLRDYEKCDIATINIDNTIMIRLK